MIRGYEIVKIEGVKKEASGSPGSFYIQSEKRGIPFFLDNIYNRKNTLYRVISEPSGIERYLSFCSLLSVYLVISEPSGIERQVYPCNKYRLPFCYI